MWNCTSQLHNTANVGKGQVLCPYYDLNVVVLDKAQDIWWDPQSLVRPFLEVTYERELRWREIGDLFLDKKTEKCTPIKLLFEFQEP